METKIISNANYILLKQGIIKSTYLLVDDEEESAVDVLFKNGIPCKYYPDLTWLDDDRFILHVFKVNKKFNKVLENTLFPIIDNKLKILYNEAYDNVLIKLVGATLE